MDNEETQPKSVEAAQKKEQLKNRVLRNGESFGNYRVVKCISSGLIAHYYHMQHIRDLHDVTVGVFHYRAEGSEKLPKRLELLQKTLATFDHEAFPKIRDCGRIEERCCIFLEPIEGQTLSQYFETTNGSGSGMIGAETVTHLIAQLYGALGYAHAQGLDHRDLESDLIFVQKDGSIRILGLGIKAALGVELFEAIVSASVSPLVSSKRQGRLNSFDIMSPEYRSGVQEDNRVDVYGVGFIGYWLLTGSKADMANYQPPSKLIEGLSPEWDAFFEQSLERSQDKRFQSCRSALLGLKGTEEETSSEGAGHVQRQIDRIPVPKKIVERGDLATRIYRLFIIGLVGVTLIAIGASYINVLYETEDDPNRPVAKVATSNESAVLQLKLEPADANVEFVGHAESFTAKQGNLNLSVEPGEYRLRVSAPNRKEELLALTIPESVEAPLSVEVVLKLLMTDIVIETEPGASITAIDGRGVKVDLGVAGSDGVLSIDEGIAAGTYGLSVQKEGYQTNTLEGRPIEFGEKVRIEAPLLPLPVRLSVSTQPPGASVMVNEIEFGKTPVDIDDIAPSDQYLIVARLEGFRPVGRRIEVEPGSERAVDFGKLIPLSGALSFEVSVLGNNAPEPSALYDDLTVVMDEKPIAFGDKKFESVSPGARRIRLEHPLYLSKEFTINVEDKQKYLLEVALYPRPGRVQLKIPGDLESQVRINGQAASLEEGRIEIPAYEEVDFELSIRNHLTMMRTFELAPDETLVWNVEPVSIPGPAKGQGWKVPYYEITFAWVPPGQFEMGSPLVEHARLPNEGPPTRVRFTRGFWAGVYEVTQALYFEIVGRNPSAFESPAHPVESVTWSEAKRFCALLTETERDAGRLPEGYVYRLPTEAEWEYAARAGTTTPFHFGAEADASSGHFRGVYPRDRQDGLRAPSGYGTAKVGRYQANAYGLYDVHGNVREWTLDYFNGRLEGGAQVDPRPRSKGSRISVRGGGWEDTAARVRSAAREEISPDLTSNALGFRVVLAPEL